MGRNKKTKENKKRQKVRYSEEAEKFIRDNYEEMGMYNMQQGLKKITGKLITYNAIRIKAFRMGIETKHSSRTYILLSDLNESLHTTQGGRYAKAGGFGRKEKGVNGVVVNVEKFWKWAEHSNIDFTGYERGTLLPEPKKDETGRSWLDRRIAQQVVEKYDRRSWDQMKIAKLKRLVKQGDLNRKQIAERLGMTVSQVNSKVADLKLTKNVRINVTDREREEVRKLYNEGTTIAELMQMYSRQWKTIENIIK